MDLLNRKEIAKGVFFSKIVDKRFKQNKISICFLTQLNKNKASVNAVIPKILTNSCRAYPDIRTLNERLSALYAARLTGNTGSLGDTQYVDISIKTIDNRYAIEKGEDILGDGLSILLNCIFEPLAEEYSFNPAVTEIEKQACIDQIEAELNEKRVYAINRATELLHEGEPGAIRPNGTVEGVKAVSPERAFTAYKNLLKTARIEIICAGRSDFSNAESIIKEAFSSYFKREERVVEDCYSKISEPKARTREFIETMDVNQSKMVLGFKTSGKSEAVVMATKIYGGSATSKLFENVREKMSLCYYCWAKFNPNKGAILTECGVETENIEKAKAEILRQLELMKSGDFSEEELINARASQQNDLKTVNDSLTGIKLWYLNRIYRCDIATPEQIIERYSAVTREEIIEAANSLVLDTVYVLTEKEKA